MGTRRKLVKAGANWVDGEKFFNRKVELDIMRDRVREGRHTLLTAQRRIGKTSLVRELLRCLAAEADFETVFVDLEHAADVPTAIAEIVIQARSVEHFWSRIKRSFATLLQGLSNRVEEVKVADLEVKLRKGIDAGNWNDRGDQVFADLAACQKPVVLAIDELPILVNRLLRGNDHVITPKRRGVTDLFLSSLRKNGQAHQDRVCMIVSGSISLEPLLHQVNLGASINIFSPFELKPWDRQTSMDCLAALARNYGLDLSCEVRSEMCCRLRYCIPHHVQLFFEHLHEYLRRHGKRKATLSDIGQVYEEDILGVRGQVGLSYYESRLKMVLGERGYTMALDLLTEAAVNKGFLTQETLGLYRAAFSSSSAEGLFSIDDVLHILEHDGYLAAEPEGYRFMSGLLEDWWQARYSARFTPIAKRKG